MSGNSGPAGRRRVTKADLAAMGQPVTRPRKRAAKATVPAVLQAVPVKAASAKPAAKRVAGRKPGNEGRHGKVKVAVWMDPEDAAQVRGTFLGTQDETGHSSVGALMVAAVLNEVERLEKRYNGGEPYPPAPPGTVPTGRPKGS